MGLNAQKIKSSKEGVEDALHEACIVNWDTEYRVLFQSDDGGNHVAVAFEGEAPLDSKDLLRSPFMGWRLVRLVVPNGYLAAFHPLDKR